jgi:RimJ/RimL family protein N-acetyltransferase
MEITQRNARLTDAQIILDWRNSAEARAFSVNPEILSLDEHTSWMVNRLEKIETDPFLLFFENDIAVGFTRFDFIIDTFNRFEISILIDSKLQGTGLGTRILQDSCKFFFSLHPKGTIVARVHKFNFASQRVFAKNKFEKVSQISDFHLYELSSRVN